MKLEPFDFSENISKQEIFDHVRYYYTNANIAMRIMETDKREAMDMYGEIRKNLDAEYTEYHKSKNYNFIRRNKLYVQYVDNLTKSCIKPTRVTSYAMLSSNLYDVQDYIDYGFNDFLEIQESNNIDLLHIDKYIGKKCKIITKDYLVFEGKMDLMLCDLSNENNEQVESISIYDFERWHQIYVENIKSIKIIED